MDITKDYGQIDKYQLNTNQILIFDEIINRELCEELIVDFQSIPLVETTIVDGIELPKDDSIREGGVWRVENRPDCQWAVLNKTKVLDDIVQKIDFALPKGVYFGNVTQGQFYQISEGDFVPWSNASEEIEKGDSGTVIVFLNDDFVGGDYVVNNHTIQTRQGTVIGHNFHHNLWTSFQPIQKGTRFYLQLYFELPSDLQEIVDNASEVREESSQG
tara:strand:+ start:197 stop:844 length:648 start_codon:yes stop_codon:yes gene_type:complete